jgi:hypothetical protein
MHLTKVHALGCTGRAESLAKAVDDAGRARVVNDAGRVRCAGAEDREEDKQHDTGTIFLVVGQVRLSNNFSGGKPRKVIMLIDFVKEPFKEMKARNIWLATMGVGLS